MIVFTWIWYKCNWRYRHSSLLRLFCSGTRNCGRHVYAYSPPPLVQLTHNSKENASIPYETMVMTALAVNHYLNLQWKICVSIDFYCEITTFYRFYLHFIWVLVISVKTPYFPFWPLNFSVNTMITYSQPLQIQMDF